MLAVDAHGEDQRLLAVEHVPAAAVVHGQAAEGLGEFARGPGLAVALGGDVGDPLRGHDLRAAATAAVEHQLPDAREVVQGAAQAAGGARCAFPVERQGRIVLGAERAPDAIGQQRGQRRAARTLQHPAQQVGVGRHVAKGPAMRRLARGQAGQEAVQPLARRALGHRVPAGGGGIAPQVLGVQPRIGAHVEQLPHGGARVAGVGDLGHVLRGRHVHVEPALAGQHAAQQADDGLGGRHEDVHGRGRHAFVPPLAHDAPVPQHEQAVAVGAAQKGLQVQRRAARIDTEGRPVDGRLGQRRGLRRVVRHHGGGQDRRHLPEGEALVGRLAPVGEGGRCGRGRTHRPNLPPIAQPFRTGRASTSTTRSTPAPPAPAASAPAGPGCGGRWPAASPHRAR